MLWLLAVVNSVLKKICSQFVFFNAFIALTAYIIYVSFLPCFCFFSLIPMDIFFIEAEFIFFVAFVISRYVR